ncbi:methyl-accepting chemotaxis protein [Planctomycetota bacterium]
MSLGWKNMSVGLKIGTGFAVVLTLLVIIGLATVTGVGRITTNAKEVISGAHLDGLLGQREIDHLNWTNKVTEFLVDSQTTKIEVQTDDHKCGFGKWLYGEGREHACSQVTSLSPLLKSIEEPHHQLHASVMAMQQAFDQADNPQNGKAKAAEVFRQTTLPALAHVQGALHKIREEAKSNIVSDEELLKAAGNTRKSVGTLAVLAIVVGACLAVFLTLGITRPIKKAIDLAIKMASGDLTERLETKSGDEVGILINSLNDMADKLAQMFKDITGGVEILASSSQELSTVSEQMTQGSQQTSERASTVATGAEEMSANVRSMAAAMEQSATNVNTVSTASEQMTGAITEIAQNTERATMITTEAVSQARNASEKINLLGDAAQEIGKVTETITEISEQTNLLALNATIEAARAGDAGKGFAVVANEIKDLANQTAQATEEIRSRIDRIQGSTGESVQEIEKITKVITDVNDIVGTIASAVEEQSVTTKEIAENIVQASQGIQEVNENVAQTSSVAGSIAQDIAEVNKVASDVSNGSEQVRTSSGELSKLAAQLQQMVGQFKTSA